MLHREGRISEPQPEVEPHHHAPASETSSFRNWEASAVVIIAVVLLITGAVAGVNWMLSLFPWVN